MSMEHKAFVFDYRRFREELASLLYAALENDSAHSLIPFIRKHEQELAFPADGERLRAGWESVLPSEDVDCVGAVALTRYYDPLGDIGVHYDWQELQALFPGFGLLFGVPFGPARHRFDPGRMGSWFQSPEMTWKHEAHVREVASRNSGNDLSRCLAMFRSATEKAAGLYVRF